MNQPLNDTERITLGIMDADLEGRSIDEPTARLIASQLHGGMSSALYSLASSGHIDHDRLSVELNQVIAELEGQGLHDWFRALGAYVTAGEAEA